MLKTKKIWFVTLMLIFVLAFSANASAAFTVKKTNVATPSTMKVGQTFSVKGTLNSNQIMTKVVVSLIKDNKQVQRYEARPYSMYYNLAKADNAMLFNKLTVGEYIYRVSAFDNKNTKFAVCNKKFSVVASGKINITNPAPAKDFTIKQGTGVVVGGKITSTYKIASVTATIVNSNGKTVQKKTVYPKTTTYNMTTNKTIDNAMLFDRLSAGTYKFQVKVVDAKGTSVLAINRKFTVSLGSTTPGAIGGPATGNGQYSDTTATIPNPSGFSPRTSRPGSTNKYYYNSNYNIYYKYNSIGPTGNEYYSGHYVTGNCTWYACGRAMEIVAKKYGESSISKVQAIFGGDPVSIYNMNVKLGKFKYGKSPKPGAIAVFNYGGNSGDAHVAIVEQVINGVPYVSESGYTVSTTKPKADKSNVVFWYQSIYAWSGGRQLLGYIYLI